MAKYEKEHGDFKGWTRWIWPKVHYKMACCDCGLVHDCRFVVFKVKDCARGMFNIVGPVSRRRYRVGMKVKRNERATAAVRRKKKT